MPARSQTFSFFQRMIHMVSLIIPGRILNIIRVSEIVVSKCHYEGDKTMTEPSLFQDFLMNDLFDNKQVVLLIDLPPFLAPVFPS